MKVTITTVQKDTMIRLHGETRKHMINIVRDVMGKNSKYVGKSNARKVIEIVLWTLAFIGSFMMAVLPTAIPFEVGFIALAFSLVGLMMVCNEEGYWFATKCPDCKFEGSKKGFHFHKCKDWKVGTYE